MVDLISYRSHKKPIVFGGASIDWMHSEQRELFDIHQPIQRGGLDVFVTEEPGCVLITDGVFGGQMAITPHECRVLIEAGWQVYGSSSMGALRAADLWSVGMIGVGEIYELYRAEKILSDAEVAVVYDQQTNKETTASLVHVRKILSILIGNNQISCDTAQKLLDKLRKIIWYDRHWPLVINILADSINQSHQYFKNLVNDPNFHPKKLDARKACSLILSNIWHNVNI